MTFHIPTTIHIPSWTFIVVGVLIYLVIMFGYGIMGPGANIEAGTGPSFWRCLLWPISWMFPE